MNMWIAGLLLAAAAVTPQDTTLVRADYDEQYVVRFRLTGSELGH